MYGSKGRIGLLVPTTNGTMENEFHIMAPEGVAVLTGRMGRRRSVDLGIKDKIDGLKKMTQDLENAAEGLVGTRIKVVVYGCTSGSFIEGVKGEINIVHRLQRILSDIPVVTATGAVLSALRELGIKKLAVGTPYTEEVNVRLRRLLDYSGFRIVSFKGLELSDVQAQPPKISYNLAKEIDSPDADGIFISCTSFRTIENIERLEQESGKPIVTSNQASMWRALKEIGYKESIKGYGKLLMKL